jgi:hypothetical protein
MPVAQALEGTWITKVAGRLFLINLSKDNFELIFELPEGTSMSMGKFALDATKTPWQMDLTLTDGIGKNRDRLRGSTEASVVRAIVQYRDNVLSFFAPPPEIEGRPTEFPVAKEGLVGKNLYLVLKRPY